MSALTHPVSLLRRAADYVWSRMRVWHLLVLSWIGVAIIAAFIANFIYWLYVMETC